MLGWEYPPNISGGLGTACQGLTSALADLGVDIDFVVPNLYGDETADHMNLIDSSVGTVTKTKVTGARESHSAVVQPAKRIKRVRVPAFLAPYWTEEVYEEQISKLDQLDEHQLAGVLPKELIRDKIKTKEFVAVRDGKKTGYSGDLFGEIERYASNVMLLAADREFDLIHAHDWITFPAAAALARVTGKPLVAHVHSLETDRSSNGGSPRINAIENLGISSAQRVIAVSRYTGSVISKQHGIDPSQIRVVHNGMVPKKEVFSSRIDLGLRGKIVLFLGRVTYQKGPEYFVDAASRVLPHCPDTTFVMAGSGDMLPKLVESVSRMGLSDKFVFTGFLKGREVDEMFAAADLYVMPSVSEPFGLTALEAITFGTPVILSKTSGVSEVLQHALKFDFWDTQKLADLIINCLQHNELREHMVQGARRELDGLSWHPAAVRTKAVYEELLDRRSVR